MKKSSCCNLFYAHPHPGPLPRGEGEYLGLFHKIRERLCQFQSWAREWVDQAINHQLLTIN
jgi:hypothetical protein